MKIKFWGMMLLLIAMGACENNTNYSQLLKAEEELIADWLVRNEITLLEEFPADTVFAANQMYHFEDGIYFQVIENGVGDTLRAGDKLILRYKQSTLDLYPMVEDYWTTQDRPYPNEIAYGSLTNSCEGWQKAFELMQKSDAHARIIVPSKLGRNNSEVIPYVYEMKIRRVPK
jgi:hypothetical protein